MKKLSAAILLCAAIGACNTDSTNSNDNTVIGGPCDYEDTAGVATIVSVEPAATNGLNCGDDAVEIVFDFAPDDPAAADLAETGLFVAVSEGVNPDRAVIPRNRALPIRGPAGFTCFWDSPVGTDGRPRRLRRSPGNCARRSCPGRGLLAG